MKRLVILFVLFSATAYVFAQNPTAVIREMTGTVELKKSGAADWIPARAGDTIDKATIVSTGFKSTAFLAVGNSVLTVRPLTRLSLENLMSQNNAETVNINLNTGRIRAEVNPPAGNITNFTVRSPQATASVRGTSFQMDGDSIQVLTGAISYAASADPSARPVSLSAGQESWVNTDTGSAVTAMAAAETASSLPSLPGQSAGTITESGRLEPSRGSLVLSVNLYHGEY